jgi:hypothetical protein
MAEADELQGRLSAEWRALVQRLVAAGTPGDEILETMIDVGVNDLYPPFRRSRRPII